ncbi:MAG: RIP metalloprotease RseP [Candidatus Latescibacteria bacterium]|nr:RIP metalloprotease RseP [Candidatus Latescibacterota bacterium]
MLTTALSFLFVLGVLIFVHELGHFAVAKASGIRVERFSLGYPPKMIGWQYGETEYCLSWIPFGGYVKMAGQSDVGEAESTGQPWEFGSKSPHVQAGVIAAGPAMNFLLAFLIFFVFVLAGGVSVSPTTEVGTVEAGSVAGIAGVQVGDRIVSVGDREVSDWTGVADVLSSLQGEAFSLQIERGERILEIVVEGQEEEWASFGIAPFIPARIGSVMEDGPAARIGLEAGDLVVSVDGEPVGWMKMTEIIRARPGQPVALEWKRGTQMHEAQIVPEVKTGFDLENQKVEYGRIGVGLQMAQKRVGPITALGLAAKQTVLVTAGIVDIVRGLISGGISPKLLGGPVMIAQMAGEQARLGIESLFSLMALLSVNLGLLNILPIPALDGGHLFFIAAEGLTRRKLSIKQKAVLQRIGMALILILMVYVTHNDILRLLQLR